MRFGVVLLILFAVATCGGCRERSVPPEPPPVLPPEVSTGVPIDPLVILDRMATAYKTANSYSDCATVRILGKMSQPDVEPAPWNCLVVFQRPNRLRVEVNEGIFISDGEDCYAQIRPLPDQVLHFPALANWTLETLFQDVHLDAAMTLGLPRSVLRFPPQLVLLFANNPLHTFIPRGARVEWIAQQHIDETQCDVVQIMHSDGNRVLWISREDFALLRMDYQPVGLPVPEGFDSIDAIRIELTNAEFDSDFGSTTFQMLQPQGAVQVAEFHADASGLPTQEEHRRRLKLMADNDSYRLIDQHAGSAISSEQTSLSKTAPRTFTLTPAWSQPLMGVNTMAILPGEPRKLLIPYAGNVVAILDFQGNVLNSDIKPEGLGDSIIMNIRSNSDNRRIGILTLEGKFHLFDEAFKPITVFEEEIRHFRFVQYREEALLLLAIDGVIRAVDSQGTKRWEYSFEGVPNQISSALIDDQLRVLVSCTAAQDSILVLSLDGLALDPVGIPMDWRVLWFGHRSSMNADTIYTLWENPDTGHVRFAGLDRTGKSQWSQWSRALPPGEYEIDPVLVPSEEKWLVSTPSGEIGVFDQIGNVIDRFSLDVVPTGLLCLEVNGETLLIVADGETVTAWKMGKKVTQ